MGNAYLFFMFAVDWHNHGESVESGHSATAERSVHSRRICLDRAIIT